MPDTLPKVPSSETEIKGDARDVLGYRVEWRHNLVTHWVLIGSYSGYGTACDASAAALTRWKGQVRIIKQEFVYAEGLGHA